MLFRKIIIITALAAAATSCGTQSGKKGSSAAHGYAGSAIPVFMQEVVAIDIPTYIESVGTLTPFSYVEIKPEVSGILQEIHFNAGDRVQTGDLLFSIDSRAYAIRLKETQAQLKQSQASLSAARNKLSRYNSLSRRDIIPEQEWDELETHVMRCEAQVSADEARVEAADLDMKRCRITAPGEGVAGITGTDSGNFVSPAQSTPLTVLSGITTLTVTFNLTEKEFSALASEKKGVGTAFEITSLANPEISVNGSLSFLDHTFNPKTGLLHVKGIVDNKDRKFLPGQHVVVKIQTGLRAKAKLISQKAVKMNQSGPYVYVINAEDNVEIRQVEMGEEAGKDVVILDGLLTGERVVTEGHLRLAPGLKVEIKQEQDSL